ncbi:hypothetical protein L2E82_02235 [Cichorium intybus]|uniref:Uncharacterized protein n=1 Tax=Cichorium intybus TaxID=13427 RepID=A0ACB9H2N8_CICIN|nr:hypothetical protein L2E82_02235 [Cichorium intybus]
MKRPVGGTLRKPLSSLIPHALNCTTKTLIIAFFRFVMAPCLSFWEAGGLVDNKPFCLFRVRIFRLAWKISRLDDPVMWGFKGFPTCNADLQRWLQTFPEGKVCQEDEPIRRLKWGTASLIVRSPIILIVLPVVHHGFEKDRTEKVAGRVTQSKVDRAVSKGSSPNYVKEEKVFGTKGRFISSNSVTRAGPYASRNLATEPLESSSPEEANRYAIVDVSNPHQVETLENWIVETKLSTMRPNTMMTLEDFIHHISKRFAPTATITIDLPPISSQPKSSPPLTAARITLISPAILRSPRTT